jgi:hypothetical protein
MLSANIFVRLVPVSIPAPTAAQTSLTAMSRVCTTIFRIATLTIRTRDTSNLFTQFDLAARRERRWCHTTSKIENNNPTKVT